MHHRLCFFGCNSEKCSSGWWEFSFSPICLSLKCSKKCFCWVVDSILPLFSGLKKGQLPKIHTYLVTCRQGISDAGASCSILCDRLLYTKAGVENCLGWKRPCGRTVLQHTKMIPYSCVCVYRSSGCVWVCTYKIGGYMHVPVCGSLARNLCNSS